MKETAYPTGGSYIGEWNKWGKKHGKGVLTSPSGTVYKGEFELGIPNGLGVIEYADGTVYSGAMKAGFSHGLGVLEKRNGFKVEGNFEDGKPNGLGRITFPDGSHGIPRHEGYLQSHRIKQRQLCPETVEESCETAARAKLLVLDLDRAYTPQEEEMERAKMIATAVVEQMGDSKSEEETNTEEDDLTEVADTDDLAEEVHSSVSASEEESWRSDIVDEFQYPHSVNTHSLEKS